MKCPKCDGTETEYDHARGDVVCIQCGEVLEENVIVSEVTFAESSGGGTSRVGQIVGLTGPKTKGARGQYSVQSRQITLERGKRELTRIGASLNISGNQINAAHGLYKLAVEKNFTAGRRLPNVCVACLYVVCRRDKTPHLLIDFSELLEVNLFVLGSCFLKLCKELHVTLPVVDPSLYIHRFAAKLELEEKAHGVGMTALKLVTSMKRDWIQVGRTPAGVLGAALLIACRVHGFRRSISEVVRVVRIAEVTLRKRLDEFEMTPVSGLSIDDFEKGVDITQQCDPPSFIRGQRKQQQQEEPPHGVALPVEIQDNPDGKAKVQASTPQESLKAMVARMKQKGMTTEDIKAFVKSRREQAKKLGRSKKRRRKDNAEDDDTASVSASESSSIADRASITSSSTSQPPSITSGSTCTYALRHKPAPRSCAADDEDVGGDDLDEAHVKSLIPSPAPDRPHSLALALPGRSKGPDKGKGQGRIVLDAGEMEREMNKAMAAKEFQDLEAEIASWRAPRPPMLAAPSASSQAPDKVAQASTTPQHPTSASSHPPAPTPPEDDGRLSDVEDDEVRGVLLNDQEVEAKTRVWMAMNHDYLLWKEERDQKKQEELAARGSTTTRKRKPRTAADVGAAPTAYDAAVKGLNAKNHSSKINWDKVKGLFGAAEKMADDLADATASAAQAAQDQAGDDQAAAEDDNHAGDGTQDGTGGWDADGAYAYGNDGYDEAAHEDDDGGAQDYGE